MASYVKGCLSRTCLCNLGDATKLILSVSVGLPAIRETVILFYYFV